MKDNQSLVVPLLPLRHAIAGTFTQEPLLKRFLLAGLLLLALGATSALRAQTCENVGSPGGESVSASIKIKDTNIAVTDGMVVPTWTVLQIDSVTTATGLCTGMAWANTSEPSCEPTGFVWNRNPSHTYLWADISTATALNGTYQVGVVWPLINGLNVLDTQAGNTTGPVQFWVMFPGTYEFHVQGRINTTPCNLLPAQTETVTITVHVAENDGATNFGEASCQAVGKPVNVTNGNMYLQQTDYRLPGFGGP